MCLGLGLWEETAVLVLRRWGGVGEWPCKVAILSNERLFGSRVFGELPWSRVGSSDWLLLKPKLE